METSDSTSSHPYEMLTPDCILAAIESQGYLSDARILGLNSYENRVYQVGIEGSAPIIVKFYRPERWSEAQIKEEHEFTQHLADLEIPAVPPLQNAAGETLFEFAGFRFALFPRQGGHAPELDSLDNLMMLGRYLGRIHAAKHALFEHRPTVDINTLGKESVKFLSATQADGTEFIPFELKQSYTSLCEHLLERVHTRFDTVSFENIRLHGDCHIGNVLWRDDRPHFVDFDDARNGPAIQDLWMLLSGDREQQTQQIGKLISGYRQFCDFNPAELGLIESLRTLRIMHYAAWLARRWGDPAFPHNFPWFNTQRYWSQHILELREQLAAIDERPIEIHTVRGNW